MHNEWYTYPNRTLCDTLEEMRKIANTRNIKHLSGLIEEAQTYANRMEAALEDWSDVRDGHKKKHELKDEIRELSQQRDKLKLEVTDLENKQAQLLTDTDTIKRST